MNQNKVSEVCSKGPLSIHKWVRESRISGAGRIIVTKFKSQICDYCGATKPL